MTIGREINADRGQGPMPLCNLRPAEWKTWTGRRAHDKPPTFDDPEDFGIAVNAWWSSMKGVGSSEHDSREKMRKSGPNGLVSLLLLLLWWGREALKGPSAFKGDSAPLWHNVVGEVCATVEQMLRTDTAASVSESSSTPNNALTSHSEDGA